jgi:23S rRNA (cytosine1962-C5)-methyltransferase
MSTERTQVILSSGKDQSLKRFHPWVFSGAIKKIKGPVQEGDLVDVFSNKDEYLGTGHFAEGSIAVRMVSFEQKPIDAEFWKEKVRKAFEYRRNIGLTDKADTNVYRMIYAEGDGLPGLIVDYYNGTAVFQAHSPGMHKERMNIANALKEVLGDTLTAIYDKSAESLHRNSDATVSNGYILGSQSGNREVAENGNKFLIDWETGQKTGFFVDQRDNRALLAKYSKGKSVCNTFCYTGGFSVYAGNAGATLVHSVDSSKKAIALTDKNMELNRLSGIHASFAMDTFDFLKDKDNAYDVIILDPPAFAKSMSAKHHAVMGYKRLNAEAISKIRPGGILFTFSCSQVVDRRLFSDTIMSAAIVAGRNVRVLHHLTQPADHPVNIFHPEGEYLKGLVLYIE